MGKLATIETPEFITSADKCQDNSSNLEFLSTIFHYIFDCATGPKSRTNIINTDSTMF